MHSNGIAFAPLHDTAGSKDAERFHTPLSRAWCKERGLPSPFLYDNRKPRFERTQQIKRELLKQRTQLDCVSFYGYGSATGTQTGFSIENVQTFAIVLLSCLAPESTIEFWAVDPVLDTSGLAADDGFAHKLHQIMANAGRWFGQTVVHAVNAEGERVCRIFEGDAPGIWVP